MADDKRTKMRKCVGCDQSFEVPLWFGSGRAIDSAGWRCSDCRLPPAEHAELVKRAANRRAAKPRAGRGLHPATSTDYEYDDSERLWLAACDAYRRQAGKAFLTATDYLKVAVGLGYRKAADTEEKG